MDGLLNNIKVKTSLHCCLLLNYFLYPFSLPAMPYLQREWSKYLGYGAPTPTYKLRTIPLVESVDLMAQGISAEHALGKEPSSDPPKADCVDRFFVIQLRNELTKQVGEYQSVYICF